jgi:hypothetical protein
MARNYNIARLMCAFYARKKKPFLISYLNVVFVHYHTTCPAPLIASANLGVLVVSLLTAKSCFGRVFTHR